MGIRIGSYPNKVTVEAPYYTLAAGANTPTWVTIPYGAMWARVEPLTGREQMSASAVMSLVTHRIFVRYNRWMMTDDMPATYPTDSLLAFYGMQEDPSDATIMGDDYNGSYDAVTDSTWETAGLGIAAADTNITLNTTINAFPSTITGIIKLTTSATISPLVVSDDGPTIRMVGGSSSMAVLYTGDTLGITEISVDEWCAFQLESADGAQAIRTYTKADGWKADTAVVELATAPTAAILTAADSYTLAALAIHSGTIGDSGKYRVLRSLAPWAERVHGVDFGLELAYPDAPQFRIARGRRVWDVESVIDRMEEHSELELRCVEVRN